MKECTLALVVLALLSATLVLAEDFKTVRGKLYKDATVIRVEADGIVLKSKTGISKVYFIELPNDVQERFRPRPAKTVAPLPQRVATELKASAPAKANRTTIIFIVAGAIIIAGVVFVIVRRRFQ